MTMQCDKPDSLLLKEYAQAGAQAAFAAIVQRHANLVYASARRQLCARGCGDQLAEDVTQAVFLVLARKAGRIATGMPLSSWLTGVTRYAVRDAIKAQRRRNRHETGAAAMKTELPNIPSPSDLEPILDEGIARLNPTDRNAILLRFAENRTMAEVGEALGVSGDAARARIDRAVEKLRGFFATRGVTAGNAMAIALLEQSLTQHAPSSLVQSVLSATFGTGASASAQALTQSTLRAMVMAKLKATLAVTAAVLVATATGAVAWKAATQPQSAAQLLQPATPLVSSVAAPPPAAAGQGQAVLANLAQFRDALRANDRQAIDRLIAVPAGTRGTFMRLLSYEAAATIHLDRAWRNRFAGVLSFRSVGFHSFPAIHASSDALLDAVIEVAKPSDVTITGASARLRVDLTKSYPPDDAQWLFDSWAAPNFAFTLVDGAWKQDMAGTMQLTFRLQFMPGHSAKEQRKTEEEVEVAFTQDIISVLDEAAARIERGDFLSPQTARSWTRTEVGNVFDRHFLSSSGFSADPVK